MLLGSFPQLLRSNFTDSKVDQNRTSYKLGNQQQNGGFKHFDCAYPKNMLTINKQNRDTLREYEESWVSQDETFQLSQYFNALHRVAHGKLTYCKTFQ